MVENLKKLATWTNFMGWVTFICGILSAIPGVFMLGIGAVPGVISAMLGWKLITVAKNANQIARNNEVDEATLTLVINDLTTYFKVQGIMMIVVMVLMVIVMVASFALFGTMLSEVSNSLAVIL